MIPPIRGDLEPSQPKRESSLRPWGREEWLIIGIVTLILCAAAFVIFWPVFAVSGPRPPSTKSILNLKKIVFSFQIYLADSDDTFPPKENWQKWHRRYFGSSVFETPYKAEPGGYCYNAALDGLPRLKITKPDETPIVFECRLTGADPYGGVADLRTQDPKVIVVLADGSARRLTLAEARSLIWNPKSPGAD